jgi:hypothetical protein
MAEPLGERVAAVETALSAHLRTCERVQERNFRLLIVILGALITLAAKQFGVL